MEWSHNTSWNVKSDTTPYEITYGRKPFNIPEYLTDTSNIDAIDELLTNREATFAEYRKKLLKAQERMKQVVDTKRRDVTFNTGDWVMVKLRPYRQTTVTGIHGGYLKLTKRFYGPF